MWLIRPLGVPGVSVFICLLLGGVIDLMCALPLNWGGRFEGGGEGGKKDIFFP